MDSLLSKMASLKAFVPSKKGLVADGNDPSQMQPLSVKVCVCRSAPTQTMSNSGIATNTPPMQEGSTESAFTPLPLPSSRTSVPASLKFLWFNRRGGDTLEDGRQREEGQLSDINNENLLPLPSFAGHDEDPATSLLLSTQINSESSSVLVDIEEKIIEQSETYSDDELKEVSKASSAKETHPVDAIIQAAIASSTKETHPVDAIIQAAIASEAKENHLERKSWISRITDFKSLWSARKALSVSTSDSKTESPYSKEEAASRGPSNPEAFVDCCKLGDCHDCSLEVPYTKVLHNKETFSKFLQDASLFDMKVLAELSFLCDRAYMIPHIQPGELLRHHHLKFITSSFEKKDKPDADLREADCQKKQPRNEIPASDTEENEINTGKGKDSGHASFHPDRDFALGQKDHLSSCMVDWHERRSTKHRSDDQKDQYDLKLTDKDPLLAVAPATAVILAEEETRRAVGADSQASGSCPCEWFICDDEGSHTRFVVIQGSDSIASWQTNLFFEPTKFEGLDVLVHRGIYEAANALYEQLLPVVLAHFSVHGELTQVRLTGHSLGGSLATLLALMFQIRGVLPKKHILPVVTFGAPCIMCGGDKLLENMNLPANYIQSIIMHRDIVPRAFSCDYPDHIARILKRLNGKFRSHPCLNNQKLVYAPMGQLLILQPDEVTAPSHPLLPSGYGLYLLRHPSNEGGAEIATELRAAQRAFLNLPHPLEILSDRGAYGLHGAVSRDHNPRSYMKVVHVVLKHEVKRLRRVQREQRRQMWWPLVISETSWFANRGGNSGKFMDHEKVNGMLTPVICKSSLFGGQATIQGNVSSFGRVNFVQKGSSLWEFQKAAVSRYARLIASKHVQLGMLFIVSLRVVIVECLQTIYVWI